MVEVVVGRGDAAEEQTPQAIVLYDHDCGFCRWTLGVLLIWDRRRRLWPAPIVGAVGDRWLAGMPVEERLASWHLVEAGGRVSSAGAGLSEVMSYVPGGGRFGAAAAAGAGGDRAGVPIRRRPPLRVLAVRAGMGGAAGDRAGGAAGGRLATRVGLTVGRAAVPANCAG